MAEKNEQTWDILSISITQWPTSAGAEPRGGSDALPSSLSFSQQVAKTATVSRLVRLEQPQIASFYDFTLPCFNDFIFIYLACETRATVTCFY